MVIQGDCLEILPTLPNCNCIFADPPDNINWDYQGFNDNFTNYVAWLRKCFYLFISKANIVWLSYNTKWLFDVAGIVKELLHDYKILEARQMLQVFNFGWYRADDLSNNYRPLLRLRKNNAPIYPDQVRIESERQRLGDQRANPAGRVPSDVFEFPRVTGNSHQRRAWHPTQLHEGLVERCILLSTKEGDTCIDPFAGTASVSRVCKRINRQCTSIEISKYYCDMIKKELGNGD